MTFIMSFFDIHHFVVLLLDTVYIFYALILVGFSWCEKSSNEQCYFFDKHVFFWKVTKLTKQKHE